MDLNSIEQVLAAETNLRICPICGTPYKPYHSRQKSCGSPECKREVHNAYCRARRKKLMEEHPEEFRAYRAKAMRKYRAKLKGIEDREKELSRLSEQWKKQQKFDEYITAHGHEYGKLSAQKILEKVPKIDVNLGGNHDNVHDKDSR